MWSGCNEVIVMGVGKVCVLNLVIGGEGKVRGKGEGERGRKVM